MENRENILATALNEVSKFIASTTGTAATVEELADALGRYFVLQEIKEYIEMRREGMMDADIWD